MDKKIALFNPLSSDFSYTWLDDNNTPINLTIPAISIEYFTPPQANFMAKHLSDEIMNRRGYAKNTEEQRNEILKEIYAKVD